jgi:glycosyltransferase involved in cell wall biosynthesis
MKIAHFLLGRCNPESANGIDKTVYHLSKAEASLGHEVRVHSLTSKPPIPIPGVQVASYAPEHKSPGFVPERINDWFVARSPLNLPSALVRDVMNWEPDLLQLHFVQIPQNLVLAGRARKRGIDYCVTLNGGLNEGAQRRHRALKKLFRLAFERRYLERAAFIHAVSPEEVASTRRLGISNTFVIAPNGIDFSELPVTTDRSVLRQRFPQLDGRTVLSFVGRLDPYQKGLDSLLRALARLDRENLGLLLVGPDWRGKKRELQNMARDLEISDRVCFAGPVFGQDKWDLLAGSDLFVHPSTWEGLSFSVLEAAAMGLPLLLSTAADPMGVLEARGAAIVVEPGADTVLEGLRRFIEMADVDLQSMGSKARETIRMEFSWERTVEKILAGHQGSVELA